MKARDIFWVLFISMVPFIELRGAVPVGAVLGLQFYMNFIVAVIGNLIPVPFILLLVPFALDIMERFKIFRPIVKWVRDKADKNRLKIDADINNGKEENTNRTGEDDNKNQKMSRGAFFGLMMFVLLPLPGTGAWTGSLVAALFNFPKMKSFLAIMLGVIGCGVIMCLASYGVLGFLSFLV